MAMDMEEKKEIEVRDFYSVYSQEKVREIDEQILKEQTKYDARMRQVMATAKDFVISH